MTLIKGCQSWQREGRRNSPQDQERCRLHDPGQRMSKLTDCRQRELTTRPTSCRLRYSDQEISKSTCGQNSQDQQSCTSRWFSTMRSQSIGNQVWRTSAGLRNERRALQMPRGREKVMGAEDKSEMADFLSFIPR
jgi:hypothetical protein